jgi:hypothetical protein
VPRQVRALARKSALNARARTGAVMLVDRFTYEKPKTALLRAVLEKMGVADQKVLILTNGSKPAVYLSARNLPNVQTLPYSDVSTYHILWSDVVLIEASAIGTDMPAINEKVTDLKPTRKAAKAPAAAASEAAPRRKKEVRAEAKAAKKPAASKRKGAKATPVKKKVAHKPAAKKTAARKPAAKKAAPKKKKGK